MEVMEIKALTAMVLLYIAVPSCILVMAFSARARDLGFFLMVSAAVITDRLDVNFVSRYWYRGTTRGVEISFVDILAVGILIGSLLVPWAGRKRFYWPASLGFMLLFFLYAIFSVACSEPRIYGALELSKMLRGFLFFLATAIYVRSEREL